MRPPGDRFQVRWDEGPEREVMEAFISLPAAQKKVDREVILALAKVSQPD